MGLGELRVPVERIVVPDRKGVLPDGRGADGVGRREDELLPRVALELGEQIAAGVAGHGSSLEGAAFYERAASPVNAPLRERLDYERSPEAPLVDYNTILLDKSDRIATLTLNRPKALNGISFEMMDEIDAALDDLRADAGIKALVITGAGRAFSVGADIGLLTDAFADEKNGRFRYFLERINASLLNLEALPIPVIAKVNGLARAGGFEIILCCDLAVVADEARIGDNHTMFGVMPGGGATQRAPRKIGLAKGDRTNLHRALAQRARGGSVRIGVEVGAARRPRRRGRRPCRALAGQITGLSWLCEESGIPRPPPAGRRGRQH